MRNNDTIFLEQAYEKISQRSTILNEDDNLKQLMANYINAMNAQAERPLDPKLNDAVKAAHNAYFTALNKVAASAQQTAQQTATPAATPQATPAPKPAVTPAPQAAATPAPAVPQAVPSPAPTPTPKPSATLVPPAQSEEDVANKEQEVVKAAQAKQQAPVQAGKAFVAPNANEEAEFKRQTGTPFNPKSANDRLSLSLLRKGKPTLNTKQANAYRKAHPNWTPDTV